MKINIKNVGAISEAAVNNSGLTIITGLNGSGKSSFAKALISVLSSLENVNQHYHSDRRTFSINRIKQVLKYAIVDDNSFRSGETRDLFPVLFAFYTNERSIDDNNLESALHALRNEIVSNKDLLYRLGGQHVFELVQKRNSLKEEFNRMLFNEFNEAFNTIYSLLASHRSLNEYIYDKVSFQLDETFSGQFFPLLRGEQGFSSISLRDDNFSFDYRRPFPSRNETGKQLFVDLPYFPFNAYYISDANSIDNIKNIKKRRKNPESFYKESNGIWSLSFEDKLFNDLVSESTISDYGLNEEKYSSIMRIFDSTINYELRIVENSLVTSNGGLLISNEASGSKIFIILKTLLLKGLVDKNTLFILDEPENHLHPEWQKQLGRCIDEMCFYTGCKFIVITHSPSLLLSLDVFGNKLKENQRFNVYFCEKNNGYSNFVEYTNEIDKAHKKLNEPYIVMDLFGK